MPLRGCAAVPAVLLVALLAGGCTGSRLPAEPARSLDEANRRLDGRRATIIQAEGRPEAEGRDVTISRDTTTFFDVRERKVRRLATVRVCRVAVRRHTTRRVRTILHGVTPGLVATAVGGVGLLMTDAFLIDFLFGTAFVAGVPMTAIGGVLGGIKAVQQDRGRAYVTVYRGPAERCRPPSGAQ